LLARGLSPAFRHTGRDACVGCELQVERRDRLRSAELDIVERQVPNLVQLVDDARMTGRGRVPPGSRLIS